MAGEVPVSPVTPYSYQMPPNLFANVAIDSFNANSTRMNAETNQGTLALNQRTQAFNEAWKPTEVGIASRQVGAQELNAQTEAGRLAFAQQWKPAEIGLESQRVGAETLQAQSGAKRVTLDQQKQAFDEYWKPAEERRANLASVVDTQRAITGQENADTQRGYLSNQKGALQAGTSQETALTTLAQTHSAIQNGVAANQTQKAVEAAGQNLDSTTAKNASQIELRNTLMQQQIVDMMGGQEYTNDPRHIGQMLNIMTEMQPELEARNRPFVNKMVTTLLNSPTVVKDTELRNQLLGMQARTRVGVLGMGTTMDYMQQTVNKQIMAIAGVGQDGISDSGDAPVDALTLARLSQVDAHPGDFGKTPFVEKTNADGDTTHLIFKFPKGDLPVDVHSPAFPMIAKLAYAGSVGRNGGMAPPLPDQNVGNPDTAGANIIGEGMQPEASSGAHVSAFLNQTGKKFTALPGAAIDAARSALPSWMGGFTPQNHITTFERNLVTAEPTAFANLKSENADPMFAQQLDKVKNMMAAPIQDIKAADANMLALSKSIAARNLSAEQSNRALGLPEENRIPMADMEMIKRKFGADPQNIEIGKYQYYTTQAMNTIVNSMPADTKLAYVYSKGSYGWLHGSRFGSYDPKNLSYFSDLGHSLINTAE